MRTCFQFCLNFDFKFNLRRYDEVCALLLKSHGGVLSSDENVKVGRCALKPAQTRVEGCYK